MVLSFVLITLNISFDVAVRLCFVAVVTLYNFKFFYILVSLLKHIYIILSRYLFSDALNINVCVCVCMYIFLQGGAQKTGLY